MAMNIMPITTGDYFASPKTSAAATTGSELPFKSLFEDAIKNLEEAEVVKNENNQLLAIGEIDDIGGLMIDAQKAETALQMLVQVRNKVLDSYNEIMRMNV